jgi:thiamine biosynthesis protein ThiI
MALILIRYGEMGLKSRSVRARFESIFKENIKDFFVRAKIECVLSSDWGRIYLRTDREGESSEVLRHIFGIVSVSPVKECPSGMDEISREVAEYSRGLLKKGQTFGIRARRTGDHGYTSMQVAQLTGEAVLDANRDKSVRVNLSKPDVEIHIEVRKNHCYIFSEVIRCAGGLPLGTQGRVVAVFSEDNARSAAAAWLMMKRGCRTHIACNDGSDKWIGGLEKWDTHLHVHETDREGWKSAVELAGKIGADGLVTEEGLDAPGRLAAKDAGLPVFYPLIGLDENEIEEIKKKIQS